MVSPGRFELPAYGLGNRCSIQLSYGDPAVYVNSLPQDRLLSMHEATLWRASPPALLLLRHRVHDQRFLRGDALDGAHEHDRDDGHADETSKAGAASLTGGRAKLKSVMGS